MDYLITIPLNTDPAQRQRLLSLQGIFSDACTAVAAIAVAQQCWNRVALHHMVYREMRERFPGLGAQMVCNAVYSVCRACRLIFLNPSSPLHAMLELRETLPNVRFAPCAPVYFDRHTLSLRRGVLSLYTLEGRMKFKMALDESQEAIFHSEKLKEISLTEYQGRFQLRFQLGQGETLPSPAPSKSNETLAQHLPEYLLIQELEVASVASKTLQSTTPIIPPESSAQ